MEARHDNCPDSEGIAIPLAAGKRSDFSKLTHTYSGITERPDMMKEKTDQTTSSASSNLIDSRSARFGKLTGNESGVTAIEYALLASLIAMAIVGGVALLGETVQGMWSDIADKVANAISG